MRKTLLAAFAAASLALSACSMGASDGGGGSGNDTGNSDGKVKVGVVLKTLSSEYWQYVAAGVKAAEKELGVEVVLQGPASETAYSEQDSMIETMKADNSIQALVISPLQPDSVVSVLGDTQKPVVLVDTDAPYDKKVCYVGTGNEAAAKGGGEFIAKLAGKGAEAAWIGGIKGNTTSDDREKGFLPALKAGGVNVTVTQYAETLADKAAAVTENILSSNPNLKVIVGFNDETAAGASRAAKAAGRNDLIITGFDGIKAGVQNVIDGNVTATIAQDPYAMGYKSVEAAVKTVKGEKVEKFIDTGSSVITKDNAEEYLAKLEKQLANN